MFVGRMLMILSPGPLCQNPDSDHTQKTFGCASYRLVPGRCFASMHTANMLFVFYRTAENLPPTRFENGINSILEDFQEIQGTQNPIANPRTAGSSSLQITVQASHVCAVILLPPSPLGMLSVPSCHGNSYMAVDLFASASPPGASQVSFLPFHKLFASTSSSEGFAGASLQCLRQ